MVIFCPQERGISVGIGRGVAHITLHVCVVDVTRVFYRYTFVLACVARLTVALYAIGAAGDMNERGTVKVIELGTGVTRFASRRCRHVCHRFEYHIRVQLRRSTVTGNAITHEPFVVHRPAFKFNCIGMAQAARLQSRKVVRRLARHTLRLAVMAGFTVARFTGGYTGMGKTLYLETGRAAVAGITGLGGLHVVDRLGRSSDAASGGVTTRTILGGVLEDAVQVALLTTQGRVNVFKYESGFGVIEKRLAGGGCCLGDRGKTQCHTKKQRLGECAVF